MLLLHFKPRTARQGNGFRAGDEADGVYFIAHGEVEVSVVGRQIGWGSGEGLGEMALISGQPARPLSRRGSAASQAQRARLPPHRRGPDIRAQVVRLAAQREELDQLPRRFATGGVAAS